MAKKNQHVIPHNDNWAVKSAANEKVTSYLIRKQT
jgi:hypothetical protein